VRQGEIVGHVLEPGHVTVRAVVLPEEIDLVRDRTRRVEVRLAERLSQVLPASLARDVPKASDELPSAALGSAGGGPVATDPSQPGGRHALSKLFQVDLELAPDVAVTTAGGRVYVRFDHGWRPLVVQWYRSLRQLFLARFDV
jgi:putative peptide zinc metalloprotease protein